MGSAMSPRWAGGGFCLSFFILASAQVVQTQRPIHPDYPNPRIVLVGPTGSGKSSLANALLGCDPRKNDCTFEVCGDLDSCTKQTSIGTGKWLGTGQNFTIVDTPGFGDSDNNDEQLITEMMDILSNTLDHADTVVLLLKGTETRFTEGLQTMIKRMTLLFGQTWWEYLVFGVSFWSYSQDAIDDRQCYPDYPDLPCHDEAWFASQMNLQAQEKFGVDRNFTFVFTDSFSQTDGPPNFNTEDPLQQEHWQEETGILWDITVNRDEPFNFMTIDDILEENARQQAEIKWLNDIITNNISELAAQIAQNNEAISSNIEAITTNNLAIQDNADQDGLVRGRVAANEGNIVQTNRRVDENSAYLEHSLHPVGTIISWFGTVHTGLDLPSGWQFCDGSAINRGPMKGQTTPDLNNAGLFIRGGPDNDVAGTVQGDAVHHHHHVDSGHSHEQNGHKHNVDPHSHQFSPVRQPTFIGAEGGCDRFFTGLKYHAGNSGYSDGNNGNSGYSAGNGDERAGDDRYWCMDEAWDTQSSGGHTDYSTGSIVNAHAGLGGVDQGQDGVKADTETRPKN